MDLLKEFNHLLGPLASLVVTLTVIGGFVLWIKKATGLVTRSELDLILDNEKDGTGVKQLIKKSQKEGKEYTDKVIAAHKETTEKADAADKKWLGEIQNKFEKLSNNVFKIAGKVDIDL